MLGAGAAGAGRAWARERALQAAGLAGAAQSGRAELAGALQAGRAAAGARGAKAGARGAAAGGRGAAVSCGARSRRTDTAWTRGGARKAQAGAAGAAAWCAQLGQVGCFAAPDSVFGLVRLGIFPESPNEHCSL